MTFEDVKYGQCFLKGSSFWKKNGLWTAQLVVKDPTKECDHMLTKIKSYFLDNEEVIFIPNPGTIKEYSEYD